MKITLKMAPACDASTWEAEAGGWQAMLASFSQYRLQSKTYPQNTTRKTNKQANKRTNWKGNKAILHTPRLWGKRFSTQFLIGSMGVVYQQKKPNTAPKKQRPHLEVAIKDWPPQIGLRVGRGSEREAALLSYLVYLAIWENWWTLLNYWQWIEDMQ